MASIPLLELGSCAVQPRNTRDERQRWDGGHRIQKVSSAALSRFQGACKEPLGAHFGRGLGDVLSAVTETVGQIGFLVGIKKWGEIQRCRLSPVHISRRINDHAPSRNSQRSTFNVQPSIHRIRYGHNQAGKRLQPPRNDHSCHLYGTREHRRTDFPRGTTRKGFTPSKVGP